ncbi:D-alanyl-D-alanine carboxypeptidase family protein [Microbacterium rhizomatis]|uniref:D-alanyl-D-alanine carboxypeptidase n=1 Tax=Microbacterium rhizomatis TaxID=1631477 RepID=A0A5J5J4L6_9MICO|nr:D-alanyl-D-alanine carboxypeptidase [Microbacterium rhizomatis]KAA9108263.1 D-alanyl-D-alanine carboxypeptidase [Microbacterium rhizomatis]
MTLVSPPPEAPLTRAAARAAAAAAAGASAGAASRVALSWVDEASIARPQPAAQNLDAATNAFVLVEPDLLGNPPRRSPWRAGVLVPIVIAAALVGVYAATTLLWPLYAVAPTITAVQVPSAPAAAAAPAWPATGSAAISVDRVGQLTSTSDPEAMASITKVVTALLVLDQMPLAVGEQGPEYRFTQADSDDYWNYLSNDESALDVPVDGTLTEYQLLEGMLVGSAGNYADRLAGDLWPSDRVFAAAAESWLTSHGVNGITIVEPTGIDAGNTASPDALIPLAQRALENPVIAEIVAKKSIDLPGAGVVENTNGLLADDGVIGVKTGSLEGYNLLSAKNVTIGETTVRLYASVLGQPDDASRLAASRALYAQMEQELQPRPSVTAGTLAGVVNTRWGASVDVVTSADAGVILWNGGTGAVTTTYALGDNRTSGDAVGSLEVTGPLNTTTVGLKLSADIPDPSPWWRLTHPLDLFGLAG